MKLKIITLFAVLVFVLAGVLPASAQAPAYQTAFTTSITYQNVDDAATTFITINFFPTPTTTTPITISRDNLAKNAGTSVFIGSLSQISAGFQGTAIMQSDKRLVATLVQLAPTSTTVKNRPLSNGFESGNPNILLATVLKNQFNTNSVFSVQNTDTQLNKITIKFYNTSAALVHTIGPVDVQAGAGYYVDAGTVGALGSVFNGAAVIEARRADNSSGKVVASVMELSTTGPAALAFESVSQGAKLVNMPSALCNAFGGQNSAYAVQNTSMSTATTVTVKYSNGVNHTLNIGPGSKQSFVACSAPGMSNGFSGSATIESTATDVVAIGKVYGLGLSTGFLGAPTGSARLALPYVRWSQSQYASGDRQRTFIAIQNVGAGEIPAGSISISYVNRDGVEVAKHTINTALAKGAKVNSNPYSTQNPNAAEFGYVGGFGGGAIITCTSPGCQLIAVARVTSMVPANGTTVGEDYNGIPIP
jgi:hypothetical protein